MGNPQYVYYPAMQYAPIRSLLLDSNVTAHLDSIAERGSDYQVAFVQARVADLLGRLDSDVLVMPGLGAGEGAMRRTATAWSFDNYVRRSEHAISLLTSDRPFLQGWVNGTAVGTPALQLPATVGQAFTQYFKVVYDALLLPSYVMLLKAYQLLLKGGNSIASFKELSALSSEIYARGSRELILGALLLGGNQEGRQKMALRIMKLVQAADVEQTLDHLWNTAFDLTYTRVAAQPRLPDMRWIPEPVAFVSDDRALGAFLERLTPGGTLSSPGGGGLTSDWFNFSGLLADETSSAILAEARKNIQSGAIDQTPVGLVQKIRNYKSRKYCGYLESWYYEHQGIVTLRSALDG